MEEKYLKYKEKYLNLRNSMYGAAEGTLISDFDLMVLSRKDIISVEEFKKIIDKCYNILEIYKETSLKVIAVAKYLMFIQNKLTKNYSSYKLTSEDCTKINRIITKFKKLKTNEDLQTTDKNNIIIAIESLEKIQQMFGCSSFLNLFR